MHGLICCPDTRIPGTRGSQCPFLGDYVYAIGARTYGAGVWTDAPNTADCPAMDAWRQASFNAGHQVFPAPWPIGDCPANWGNSDISSATTAP